MERKQKILIIIAIVVITGFGFWLTNTFYKSKSTQPITASPNRTIAINKPSSNFNCKDMYDEIENDLDKANYCQIDSDCSVIVLTGSYIDFGCYHFINKDVDQKQFFTKMDAYEQKCSEKINECAPAPNVKCVSSKCVYVQ